MQVETVQGLCEFVKITNIYCLYIIYYFFSVRVWLDFINVVRKNIQLSLHVVMVAVEEKRLTEQNLDSRF